MQPPLPQLRGRPAIRDPAEHGCDATELDQDAADVEEDDADRMRPRAHTTTFTSLLPGGTMTLRTCLPSIHF